MGDFLLINHDGDVERVSSLNDADCSFVRTILELDVECGSYVIVITELHDNGKKTILEESPT